MIRKLYDIAFYVATALCAIFTMTILYHVVGFVVSNGMPLLYQQLMGTSEVAILSPDKLWAMMVSTLFLTGVTLLLAIPIAICSAIYLFEYAKNNLLAQWVRFSVQTLASIPSIIYGLFGMLVFVRMAGFGVSNLAGAGTLCLMLLPILMTQTENALHQVPHEYRQAAASLGATPFETIMTVILPHSISGILVGVLLAIGRILAESAALLFTIGGFVQMPINRETGMLSVFEAGTTLTVRAIIEFKEHGNIESASAIGVITIGVVIGLNLMSRLMVSILKK